MGTPSQQTVTTQTQLPEWQDQAWQDLSAQAAQQAATPYQSYTGDRIAYGADIPDIAQSQQMIRDIAATPVTGLSDAQTLTAQNAQTAQNLGNYQTGQFDPYQYSALGSWTDPNTQGAYMDPYMQNVVSLQQQNAIDNYNSQQAQRDYNATEAGAFGGSRQAVADSQAQMDLNTQLANIQATGAESAYNSGMGQYNTEQTNQMTRDQQQAQQQNWAQQQTEQSRQFGAQQGLNALTVSNQGAQQMAGLGQLEHDIGVQNASLLDQQGRKTQTEQQAQLDTNYQDWVNKQNYAWQQMQNQAGILAGTPNQMSTAQTTTSTPSTLQTIAGLGETAIGISGLM